MCVQEWFYVEDYSILNFVFYFFLNLGSALGLWAVGIRQGERSGKGSRRHMCLDQASQQFGTAIQSVMHVPSAGRSMLGSSRLGTGVPQLKPSGCLLARCVA